MTPCVDFRLSGFKTNPSACFVEVPKRVQELGGLPAKAPVVADSYLRPSGASPVNYEPSQNKEKRSG